MDQKAAAGPYRLVRVPLSAGRRVADPWLGVKLVGMAPATLGEPNPSKCAKKELSSFG
ncbi:MAG: hypothetical protein P8M78_13230 [Myxococcota bacterium]|nr:hypothetical protein [Myxococcota bacterium]